MPANSDPTRAMLVIGARFGDTLTKKTNDTPLKAITEGKIAIFAQQLEREVRNIFSSLACAGAAALLICESALAGAVSYGSTYDLTLLGQMSGLSNFSGVVFDGKGQSFTRTTAQGESIAIAITESEAAIGGGAYTLHFELRGDRDLFPFLGQIDGLANQREDGFVGLGIAGNPLDLTSPAALTSAVVKMIRADGTTLTGYDFIGYVPSTSAWDGTFPRSGHLVGWTELGARGVFGIDIDIIIESPLPVSEPSTFALTLISLALAAAFSAPFVRR